MLQIKQIMHNKSYSIFFFRKNKNNNRELDFWGKFKDFEKKFYHMKWFDVKAYVSFSIYASKHSAQESESLGLLKLIMRETSEL